MKSINIYNWPIQRSSSTRGCNGLKGRRCATRGYLFKNNNSLRKRVEKVQHEDCLEVTCLTTMI